MAPRYSDPDRSDIHGTDGGEARPRPHKVKRLVEVMERDPRKTGGSETLAPSSRSPFEARVPSESRSTLEPACGSVPRPSGRKGGGGSPASVSSRVVSTAPAAPPPSSVLWPSDACSILSVTPEGEGEVVAVVMSVPAAEIEGITAGKELPASKEPVKLKLYLLVEQYAALMPREGEITRDQAEGLMEAGRLCSAIRRGMALLRYGNTSARRLVYKLTAKGVARETADRAVAYLTDKGYIREDSTAVLRVEQSLRKGWGPRRIREDLRAQGFTPAAVEEALETLTDVDWEENCAEVIRKKYGEIPADRGERQKLVAALMRLGYDADTIRGAMGRLLREA